MTNRIEVDRDSSGVVRFSSDYISYKKRLEIGKERQASIPLKSLAQWAVPASRRDAIDILMESSKGRVKKLIPIRYKRMMKSSFAYLRGSAGVMAYDLSLFPNTGVHVQACGDCHLANFGVFATPERNIIFDVNDFDETLPAPFEWDIKRLAVSFYVVGTDKGLSEKKCSEIVSKMVGSYRGAIREFSRMHVLDQWYARADPDLIHSYAPDIPLKKGGEVPQETTLPSNTEHYNPIISGGAGEPLHFVDHPPLVYHPPEKWHVEEQFAGSLGEYRASLPPERRVLYDRFRLDDICIKVVGVGSVGTRCFILLYGAEEDDKLILQAKEARHSVLEPYVGGRAYDNQGERVVTGQRIMQSTSDIFLGWMTDHKNDMQYYVRQLRDMKYSADVNKMSLEQLIQYGKLCGWTLARAHTKGGDSAVIAGYLGHGDDFDHAIVEFARDYAGQVTQDYKNFLDAIKDGRLDAKPEHYPETATAG
jgi:uncharacterized protein (DUF2252 family)